jgi:hypothetical protein
MLGVFLSAAASLQVIPPLGGPRYPTWLGCHLLHKVMWFRGFVIVFGRKRRWAVSLLVIHLVTTHSVHRGLETCRVQVVGITAPANRMSGIINTSNRISGSYGGLD